MTWDIKMALDEGRTDVGTWIATWSDGAEQFVFSARGESSAKGQDAFVEAAEAARTKSNQKASLEKILSSSATARAKAKAEGKS